METYKGIAVIVMAIATALAAWKEQDWAVALGIFTAGAIIFM